MGSFLIGMASLPWSHMNLDIELLGALTLVKKVPVDGPTGLR